MTVSDGILLFFLTLFTAIDLIGFWILVRKDREGFWEGILLIVINIGTVVVSWIIILVTLAGSGGI